MAQTATPLSANWMVKDVIDLVRAITKEEDEQITSDDNIRAHLDWAIQNMFKVIPDFKYGYLIDIPFVVDDGASPMVSTIVRPESAVTARPIQVRMHPTAGENPVLQLSGLYDYHYERPANFIILGWWDVWNELSGTCRRTSDHTQLMGHSKGANTLLARTVAWHNAGRHLWISAREGMVDQAGNDIIIHGVGWRTPIRLIRYNISNPVVPTPAPEDLAETPMNELARYIPVVNDWEAIDCTDDHVPLAVNLASIKVWSQVGKISKEQESAAIEQAYGQFYESTELHLAQRENFRKDSQWKDRGHM